MSKNPIVAAVIGVAINVINAQHPNPAKPFKVTENEVDLRPKS